MIRVDSYQYFCTDDTTPYFSSKKGNLPDLVRYTSLFYISRLQTETFRDRECTQGLVQVLSQLRIGLLQLECRPLSTSADLVFCLKFFDITPLLHSLHWSTSLLAGAWVLRHLSNSWCTMFAPNSKSDLTHQSSRLKKGMRQGSSLSSHPNVGMNYPWLSEHLSHFKQSLMTHLSLVRHSNVTFLDGTTPFFRNIVNFCGPSWETVQCSCIAQHKVM